MILTGPAIQSAVRSGDVFVEPFDKANLNPNSYNYHLADSLLVLGLGGKPSRNIFLSPSGYILKSGKVYLGAERIGSDRYVTLLLGRSSIGRLGIFLNVTADLGHLGSCSHWTLELTVVQPVRVYPGMKIGQVSFWLTDDKSSHRYRGHARAKDIPVVAVGVDERHQLQAVQGWDWGRMNDDWKGKTVVIPNDFSLRNASEEILRAAIDEGLKAIDQWKQNP